MILSHAMRFPLLAKNTFKGPLEMYGKKPTLCFIDCPSIPLTKIDCVKCSFI